MEFKHISAYIFITPSSPAMEYNRNQEVNEREREREREGERERGMERGIERERTEELEMQMT